MAKGFDCATPLTTKAAALFAADGYVFAARYLVPSGWKMLTRSEAEIITAAGLQIVSVFETTADRSLTGWNGGLRDGNIAWQLAKDIGQPEGSTIYFAVDFDALPAQYELIAAYLTAAGESTPGYHIGVYGSYAVVEEMKRRDVCSRFWQTLAWSRGKKLGIANIYQYDCGPTGLGLDQYGIGVDLNESYGNEGWWNTNEITEPTIKEDESNMAMKLEQWQWDMIYKVLGSAYNAELLRWDWMQKIVDKTLTASELAFLNTVLDGRIDRNIDL